jgi:hypothetical protein
MAKKQRKRRKKRQRPTRLRRPTAGIQLVTPEGDSLAFTSAHYQHAALQEIRRILESTNDFDNIEAASGGSFHCSWFETRPGKGSLHAPIIGQRILANLTLMPTMLKVEAMSQKRLDSCCRRLEQLLGDRIRLVDTQSKSVNRALEESEPRTEPKESAMPPPDVIAEIEEKMLRQWIDSPIPALDGMTPREATKTPEGCQRVLELIDYAGRMQERMPKTPGTFSPDYRKAKKMLGLE